MGLNFYDSKREDSVNYRVIGDTSGVSDFELMRAEEQVNNFAGKHDYLFNNANIDINVDKTSNKIHGLPEYVCKINFVSDSGSFYATSKGFGIVKAIKETLSQVEIQIYKRKSKFFKKTRLKNSKLGVLADEES